MTVSVTKSVWRCPLTWGSLVPSWPVLIVQTPSGDIISRSQTALFFLLCGWGRSGKHSKALFWQSTDSGDYLKRLLVLSKGLLIGVAHREVGFKNARTKIS